MMGSRDAPALVESAAGSPRSNATPARARAGRKSWALAPSRAVVDSASAPNTEPIALPEETSAANRPRSELTETFVLVERAQDGDRDAFGELTRRYYERVRRVVRRRMGQRMRGLMESNDVVQETFHHAIRGFERFEMRNASSFINWLAKIAERTIIGLNDYFDADKRGKARAAGDEPLDVADDGPGVSTQVLLHEEFELMRECVFELRDKHRQLLLLRHDRGLTWKEIAKAVGKPSEDAARQSYKIAIARLLSAFRRRTRDRG
jgi:RNA polymerase sigma-70 factor (ECF subfamily)